ncbi:hypothetical protein [Nostocoides vanveenii]
MTASPSFLDSKKCCEEVLLRMRLVCSADSSTRAGQEAKAVAAALRS